MNNDLHEQNSTQIKTFIRKCFKHTNHSMVVKIIIKQFKCFKREEFLQHLRSINPESVHTEIRRFLLCNVHLALYFDIIPRIGVLTYIPCQKRDGIPHCDLQRGTSLQLGFTSDKTITSGDAPK